MRRFLAVILLLTSSLSIALSQPTRLKGLVTDADSGEPLPFVNIFLEGTQSGVTTDLDGRYILEAREPDAQIVTAALLGYESQSFVIVPGSYSEVNFRLRQETQILNAAVIRPDDSYVRGIVREMERRGDIHNPEKRNAFSCDLYTKMELDISNADQYLRGASFKKNFGFVFDYMDTSVVSGQPFLPVMISETAARRYHSRNPNYDREVIEGTRISGLDEENSLSQFTGSLHFKLNFYEGYINAFNTGIPSPVSGQAFYNYYLVDSLSLDGRKTYRIRFHPKKSVSTPVFDGEMNVDSEDFALRDIHARLKKGSNVNWVRDLVIDVENVRVDSLWFYKEDRMYVDFSAVMKDSTKMISFIGRRQVDYSNPDFSPLSDQPALASEKVSVMKNAGAKNEEYWDSKRPYELSSREKGIYNMVDRIQHVPLYEDIYTIATTLLKGYYNISPYFGIGPYSELVSFNKIEGFRPQLGFRTTADFSRKLRLTGYVAYGFRDKEFKGMGSAEIMFSNLPTRKLKFSARKDFRQLGLSSGTSVNNIFASVLSKDGGFNKRSPVNDFSVSYEHEWREGFSNTIALEFQRVFSNVMVPLMKPDGTPVTSVGANKLHYSARFSWNEAVTRGAFDKYYFYTKYPVVGIDVVGSLKGLGHNDFTFFRTEVKVKYNVKTAPLGRGYMHFNAGHIFGNVPYPMLKLHEGNGTYFLDKTSFACMDFYEFASDTWVEFLYEHNFGGVLFGKIPLIKKLNLREIASVKAAYGTISEHNNGIPGNPEMREATLLFPEGMGSLNKPYVEMGVGVGNIFRIFRIDAFWRMTHRYHMIEGVREKVPHTFVLNFGLEVNF